MVVVERWARLRQRHTNDTQDPRSLVPHRLRGSRVWAALGAGAVSVAGAWPRVFGRATSLGYAVPGTVLVLAGPRLWSVLLSLTRPAVATAALLIFVDCLKELPATLLLRPLGFETLATHLYGEAARGTYEDGAIAAFIIVLVGLVPVFLLSNVRAGTPRASGTVV